MVTLDTARLVAQPGQFDPGRHDGAGLALVDAIMTGHTFDHRTDGRWGIDGAGSAAIDTEKIEVARCAVTLGTAFRHLGGIFLIPMDERFRGKIGMRRREPLL